MHLSEYVDLLIIKRRLAHCIKRAAFGCIKKITRIIANNNKLEAYNLIGQLMFRFMFHRHCIWMCWCISSLHLMSDIRCFVLRSMDCTGKKCMQFNLCSIIILWLFQVGKIHRTNYLFCFINKANYIRLTAIHWWEKRILVRNRKNSNTTSEKWNWALKCLQRNRRKKCVCARGKCPNEWKMCLWKKGDTRHQAVQRVLTIWHFVHVYTSTIVAVSSGYRYIYFYNVF